MIFYFIFFVAFLSLDPDILVASMTKRKVFVFSKGKAAGNEPGHETSR